MDEKDLLIAQLRKENAALRQMLEDLQKQVKNLTEAVLLLRKGKFGAKSERTRNLLEEDGQLNLFNEIEVEGDPTRKEKDPIQVSRNKVKVRQPKTRREVVTHGLPEEEVVLDIPEKEANCVQCGSKLKPIGKKVVREALQYIPASLKIIRYVQISYECPRCKHTDNPYIVSRKAPAPVLNHSLASPSTMADIIANKYRDALPLYRQETIWHNMGIDLSRATMANWLIRCTEEYFAPLVERIREDMVQRDILHADETQVQVLKEPERKPQNKSYMWVYTTAKQDKRPAVVFDYRPSRSGDCAKAFLGDFSGYLQTDGYSAYHKVDKATHCGCWAHLRRKFVEAFQVKSADDTSTTAETGIEYCNKIFDIETDLAAKSAKERYVQRLKLEKKVLEAFWAWLDSLYVLPKSKLGDAITYARNQKPYLETYLLDGRLEISNNRAENAIRPFTIGRKNWLFAVTPKGAGASAAIYSLVESAKANGLDIYKYFNYILTLMPGMDWHNHPGLLEKLLPWSDKAKLYCADKTKSDED